MDNFDDITWAESKGKANAKAKTSSATGLGQFVDRTWLEMIRRYRPDLAQGKSDAEILELRNNPGYSREMTRRYAEENEAKLRQAGLPVTPGSTYLMHFAGPTGAIKLMQADPDTPVESILSADAIKANPHIQGKTAGWVIGWASKKMEDAEKSRLKQWGPQPPIPDLAQKQAIDPAFGATQWLQRPASPNVLRPDTVPPFAPSIGTPEYAATPHMDETRRAQQVLDTLLHAPSATPQPRPTTPPDRPPQLQPTRPGIRAPLNITPQSPELSPGMPIPGATGPSVIGGPGPLRPLVPPAPSRSSVPANPTTPAVDPTLPPLHFAPETPQGFGPFEVPAPAPFRSDVFGGSRIAPGADGVGISSSIPQPITAFGAPSTSAPAASPAASGIAGPLNTGNPVWDWWNGLVANSVNPRAGFGELNTSMPGSVPAPPTQPVFDSGLPGLLARAGAFDPPAGGLLRLLQEHMRNNPDDDVSA